MNRRIRWFHGVEPIALSYWMCLNFNLNCSRNTSNTAIFLVLFVSLISMSVYLTISFLSYFAFWFLGILVLCFLENTFFFFFFFWMLMLWWGFKFLDVLYFDMKVEWINFLSGTYVLMLSSIFAEMIKFICILKIILWQNTKLFSFLIL